MDWSFALLTILAIVLTLAFAGVWMGAALGVAAVVSLAVLTHFPVTNTLASVAFSSLDSYIFTSLPMFIFMGEIMFRSGSSDQLYSGVTPWVTKLPGRLLHSNILACTIFAMVSGSSAATAATIGSNAIPELRKRGYNEGAVIGSISGAGTLGLLIPPSLAMIVYGAIVGESIGKLFIAGIVPGLMLALLFMAFIIVQSLVRPHIAPPAEDYTWRDRFIGILNVLPMAGVIFLVLGLLYFGVSTPTEAAAIGVVAAILLSIVQRRFTWRMYWDATMGAVKITTMISFIVLAAAALSVTIASLRIPQQLMTALISADVAPILIMASICAIYVLLGCVFDGLSMQILTLPVVYPMIVAMGYDGIWFGVVLVILIEIAQITPPVGLNLYVLRSISGWSVERIALVSLPYLLILVLMIVLLFLFPGIATWLPQEMAC